VHAINKNLKLSHVSCVDKDCIFPMSIICSIVRSMNCAHLLQCLNDTFDMKKLLANLTADENKVLLAHCISKFYTLTDFQDFSNPGILMQRNLVSKLVTDLPRLKLGFCLRLGSSIMILEGRKIACLH
jgi:hypothetical protein